MMNSNLTFPWRLSVVFDRYGEFPRRFYKYSDFYNRKIISNRKIRKFLTDENDF